MSPGSPPPYGAGPYGSSPYAAPQGPTQPKGLSITALILGVLGCIPFASLAAIIIGIVALVKKQALRGAAIAGIVLGLVWTTGFIAFAMSDLPDKIRDAIREAAEQTDGTGPGPNLDTFSALNLQVGDCLNDPALERDPGLDQIEKVDCSQPHDMEVYHLSTLPDGDYPGDAQIGITASDICVAAFEDFIGTPYDDSELDFYMYYPLESTWTFANDRNVTCAAVDTDSRSTGSLQGANR